MSFGGVGISPENVAVYHGSCNVRAAERKGQNCRIGVKGFNIRVRVLATALIGFDSEVKVIFSITKKAKFNDMKSLV
ncbi:CASP-like protein 2B1 [Bienertia sinuspersici]